MINLIVKLLLCLVVIVNLVSGSVLAFPQTNAQIAQLNDLFQAIQNLDNYKIKQIIKANPNLVNMQNNTSNYTAPLIEAVYTYGVVDISKKHNALQNLKILLDNGANVNSYIKIQNQQFSLLSYFILLEIPLDKKLEIIDFLVKNAKLNLYQICFKFGDIDMYAPALIISNMPISEHRFELFKYFANKKININNALYSVVIKEMGIKANNFIKNNKFDELDLYIKSDEYQKIFKQEFKRYIYEIFKNYSIQDFQTDEVVIVAEYFVYTKDIEFIKLMISNGLIQNQIAYEKILNLANKLKNNEIINLLKGAKNG